MIDTALTRSYPNSVIGSRLFGDDFFGPALLRTLVPGSMKAPSWVPPIDIHETEDGYQVVAELPGMSKKDVNVTLEDSVLTIAGERRLDSTDSEGTLHRRERAYGSFSRSFTIPTRSDVNKVVAKFKDGLLTLDIPKAEEGRARRIEIG